jgi:hypothetical protein
VFEMSIARAEDQAVLDGQGGNPKVIGWDGDPLPPELQVDLRVMVGGLLIRQEHGDAGTVKES